MYNTTTLFLDHEDHSKKGSYRYSPTPSPDKSTGKRTGYDRPMER